MKLKVLGSSSTGNCYLLENKDECLMLEAGIRFKDVQKALSFDIGKITGCLISHEHKDHCKYTDSVISAAIDVYMSKGTSENLGLHGHRVKTIDALKRYQIGSFTVIPFPVKHDAAEPLGFLINHKDLGTLLFATDTYYIENRFRGLNHIMIECNYDDGILNENIAAGKVDGAVRNRLISSHMSIETCIQFLKSNELSAVSEIVLIHISTQNGNQQEFRHKVMSGTGKITYSATPGMEMSLNRTGF